MSGRIEVRVNRWEQLLEFSDHIFRRIASTDTTIAGVPRLSRARSNADKDGGKEVILWNAVAERIMVQRVKQIKELLEANAPISTSTDALGRGKEHSGSMYRGPKHAQLGPGPYFRSQSEVYLSPGYGLTKSQKVGRYPHIQWSDGFVIEIQGSDTAARVWEFDPTVPRGERVYTNRPTKAAVGHIHNIARHASRLMFGSSGGRMPKHPQSVFADSKRRFWMVFAGPDGKPVFIPTPAEIQRRKEAYLAKEAKRVRKRRKNAKRPAFEASKAYVRFASVAKNERIQATLAKIEKSSSAFGDNTDYRINRAFNIEFRKFWNEVFR